MSKIANILYLKESYSLADENLKNFMKEVGKQDWNEYTRNELLDIGFTAWDEKDLLLIPLVLFRMTKIGIQIKSINGQTKISTGEEDDDTRFGMTAWGVVKENSEIEKDKERQSTTRKTLGNTTASQAKDNVKDIVFWGDGDTFKLISKASSRREGWMKSTKAMEIANAGVVIQVSTQQGDNVAEALQFVPDAWIDEIKDASGKTISREVKGYIHPKY